MQSGVYAAGTSFVGSAQDYLGDSELLFYEEGIDGVVSVLRIGESIALKVNGKADASTGGDYATQLLVGHLPLLAHSAPRRALVIGLGSGITASAVARASAWLL